MDISIKKDMEITNKTLIFKVITPSEGFYLTQANLGETDEVILSLSVTLGKNDSPDNWKEISIEEGERLRAEREVELEKNMDE